VIFAVEQDSYFVFIAKGPTDVGDAMELVKSWLISTGVISCVLHVTGHVNVWLVKA